MSEAVTVECELEGVKKKKTGRQISVGLNGMATVGSLSQPGKPGLISLKHAHIMSDETTHSY